MIPLKLPKQSQIGKKTAVFFIMLTNNRDPIESKTVQLTQASNTLIPHYCSVMQNNTYNVN